MSQWGSKSLGDQGYQRIDILRYYYGDNMYINSAEEISGIPASWPVKSGYWCQRNESAQMQEQLNTIGQVYTAIPQIAEDGIFGERTKEAVRRNFRGCSASLHTGIVDYRTWYKIQEIYVAVTRIAELV